jgi:hypothetical protein
MSIDFSWSRDEQGTYHGRLGDREVAQIKMRRSLRYWVRLRRMSARGWKAWEGPFGVYLTAKVAVERRLRRASRLVDLR